MQRCRIAHEEGAAAAPAGGAKPESRATTTFIEDRCNAGIMLADTGVKSLHAGKGNIRARRRHLDVQTNKPILGHRARAFAPQGP